jgi:hypothetical protein
MEDDVRLTTMFQVFETPIEEEFCVPQSPKLIGDFPTLKLAREKASREVWSHRELTVHQSLEGVESLRSVNFYEIPGTRKMIEIIRHDLHSQIATGEK